MHSRVFINGFLSHSSKDKTIAGNLKKELEDYGIDLFVAHDDIMGGENWMSAISREIKACDIFIVLLSKEYHLADFTDHELGIAYCLKKAIIPFSIDATIPSVSDCQKNSIFQKGGGLFPTVKAGSYIGSILLQGDGRRCVQALTSCSIFSSR